MDRPREFDSFFYQNHSQQIPVPPQCAFGAANKRRSVLSPPKADVLFGVLYGERLICPVDLTTQSPLLPFSNDVENTE